MVRPGPARSAASSGKHQRHKTTGGKAGAAAHSLSNCISAGTWSSGKNTRSLSRSFSSRACSSSLDTFACSSETDCFRLSFSCCSASSSSCGAQQRDGQVCRALSQILGRYSLGGGGSHRSTWTHTPHPPPRKAPSVSLCDKDVPWQWQRGNVAPGLGVSLPGKLWP